MSSFTYDDTASGFVEDNFSQTSVPNFFNKVSTATLALEEGLKEFLENGILIYIDSDNLDSYILPTTVVDGRLNPQIEKQFKDFKLVVFMHVDGVKINRYNKVIEPAADELVILLEVNDAGNYFGSVMYAKVGANLKRRDWPLSDIFIDLDNREANISKRDLQVLLTKANFASKATLFSAFSKLIATIRGFAFNKVMNFLASITELALADGIRELKILEKFWNPEDPAYTKRYVSEGTYLLLQEKARAGVSLAEMIDPVINAACTALTAAGKQDLGSMLGKVKGVPPKLRKFMTEASIAINDETAKIISFLKASREDLAKMIIQCGIEFANGLICGLINGFLEAVAGIFDLFALILRVAGALSKGWFINKLEVFLNFKEMLENFLEAIKLYKLFDYVKLLFDIPSRIFKAILDSKIDINEVTAFLSVQFGKVSAAKVGYAIGYIIGTIIEVVLEVIATGGVAAAVKIVEYTQKLFTGVANATKHAFKAARGVTLDIATTIQTSLSMLFDSLRKGTAIDDLKKWIDELILEIKKALGLVDEVADQLPAYLDDIVAKYGQFVEKGQKRFKTTFENSLKSIDEMLSSKEFIANAEVRYARKGRKISVQAYVKKHTNRVRNFEKGSEAERIFQELFGGVKPNAIKTVHTNRFVDNLFDGIAREIKSGNIRNNDAFQAQFKKDIDIVRRELGNVQSVEWHILGEIDEKAIAWAIEYTKKYKLEKSVKFVLY